MLVLPPLVMVPEPEPERLLAMMLVSVPEVIDRLPKELRFEAMLVVVALMSMEDFLTVKPLLCDVASL